MDIQEIMTDITISKFFLHLELNKILKQFNIANKSWYVK